MVKIVFTNLIIIFFGILALELIFGGWLGQNYGSMVIPIDFKRKYNVENLYDWPKKHTKYLRDRYGLRGKYSSLASIDILTIGGSTTNEIFISEGHTWSDVLAESFKQKNMAISVVNAGVDGQTTLGNTKNFDFWFPKIPNFHARYILVYTGINDLALIRSGYYYSKQDKFWDRQRPIKQYILNNSALYSLFRNFRGMIIARNARVIHSSENFDGTMWITGLTKPKISQFEKLYNKDLIEYGIRLQKLAKRIKKFGALPIFVTQHKGSYRIKNGQIYGKADQYGQPLLEDYVGLTAINKVTMKICQALEAICIDLASNINFGDGDYYDSTHTTPLGSKKIGKFLYHALSDLISK